MLALAALVYITKDRSSIKTYFFQMGNSAQQRIDKLYDIKSIAPDDLRNKLISKYLSEYFKVIPGETNVLANRKILKDMSVTAVINKWQKDEEPLILLMSSKGMLRLTRVDSVVTQNYKATSGQKTKAYYKVKYHTLTWPEANSMQIKPDRDDGVVYMEIVFTPGIREKNTNQNEFDVKKYLKEGQNPAGVFDFVVRDIKGNKL